MRLVVFLLCNSFERAKETEDLLWYFYLFTLLRSLPPVLLLLVNLCIYKDTALFSVQFHRTEWS